MVANDLRRDGSVVIARDIFGEMVENNFFVKFFELLVVPKKFRRGGVVGGWGSATPPLWICMIVFSQNILVKLFRY